MSHDLEYTQWFADPPPDHIWIGLVNEPDVSVINFWDRLVYRVRVTAPGGLMFDPKDVFDPLTCSWVIHQIIWGPMNPDFGPNLEPEPKWDETPIWWRLNLLSTLDKMRDHYADFGQGWRIPWMSYFYTGGTHNGPGMPDTS